MNPPTRRLVWLDIAKGLGIILVVVGHVLLHSGAPVASRAAELIYLFHMPLFFLLAGVTLSAQPAGTFAVRKLIRLGLPYAFFLALLGLPALIVTCGFGTPLPNLGIDRCSVMPFKLLLGGSTLGGIFGVFWFIPCLLLALILAQSVLVHCAGRNWRHRAAVFALLVTTGYALPHLMPGSTALLALGTAPMAAAFILLGQVFAQRLPSHIVLVLSICGLLVAIGLLMPMPFDMKIGSYGPPILGLATAMALSCLLMQLSKRVEHWPSIASPLQALGQKTLTILYLHQAVHLGLRQLGVQQDALLIFLSLGVPLLFHQPISGLLKLAEAGLIPHLSPKSPTV